MTATAQGLQARTPHPVDLHVGARIRMRRRMLKISQMELAAALNLTFQQVQKYERGANRISASMLWRTARRLQVELSYFFEGLPGDGAVAAAHDPLRALAMTDGGIELAESYAGFDVRRRASLLNVARALGPGEPDKKAA